MKSRGIFIFIGAFIAAAFALNSMGVRVEKIVFLSGIALIILGIVLLKKEMSWRKNSDVVQGKVTKYYEYSGTTNMNRTGAATMYTMEVEYVTAANKLIIAKEQSGSTGKKYPEGTPLTIRYSREDPSLFIVEGDNSRIYAIIAVIVMGIAIVALLGFILSEGIQI